MELLQFALRNILRNKRRTVLTLLTLIIGTMVLFVALGFLRGFTLSLYQNVTNLDTGHVQLEHPDFRKASRRMPLDLAIPDPTVLTATLANLEGIAASSQRIDFAIEIGNGQQTMQALGRGVTPAGEAQVTSIASQLIAGTWLIPGQPGLVIGSGMAEKLGLQPGSNAYFTAIDRHSVRNLGAMPVLGIFKTSYGLLDDRMVFLDLGQTQEFLDMGHAVSRIVYKASPGTDSRALTTRIAQTLASASPPLPAATIPVAVEWRVLADYVISSIESRLKIFNFIIAVLFILIIVGIVNSMSMSIIERYREIGTLRAIGMKSRQLVRMLLAEGLLLGVAGSLVGVLVGSIFGYQLEHTGLNVENLLPRDLPLPFGSTIRAAYDSQDYAITALVGIAAAVFGSYFPARRAGRLKVLQALGTAH